MVALGVFVGAKNAGHFKHIAEERAFHAVHRVVRNRNLRRAVEPGELQIVAEPLQAGGVRHRG